MTDKDFDDDLEFDEPLDLNPWQLHDPKGLSGRPPAEPSPSGIRKFRAVVVGVVAVNGLGLFLVPHIKRTMALEYGLAGSYDLFL